MALVKSDMPERWWPGSPSTGGVAAGAPRRLEHSRQQSADSGRNRRLSSRRQNARAVWARGVVPSVQGSTERVPIPPARPTSSFGVSSTN